MSAAAMPAQQPTFTSSPAVPFASTSSAESSASPSTSTTGPPPQAPNGIPDPAAAPGPSYQQQPLQNGMTGAGGGFQGQSIPYNQYQPQQPQQPYNHHPLPHHNQQQHQPYYSRNQQGFRPIHHNQHPIHHQHQPHQQQHQQHQPQSQYQHQPDPNSHSHPQQHPNPPPHPQHTPSFQHRYPDPTLQQGYNGWTGGGGPYYPSPSQPYPQMGGPGPATMQNQNGYGYVMDQFGRQNYGGGMYGGAQAGYPPEAEAQSAPVEGDMSQQMPSFPGGPNSNQPGDYPYPPPLPNSTGQSPHPHSSSIPPGPNGSGPYQPPYFPPNHPYHLGSGLGMGYSPYAPVPNYGGYGFGDGFMPPPLPNGVNIPPHSSTAAPLPIPQSNGPSRSLNPAAQGFKFVPSNQPPPPASAPPPPIAAPPPLPPVTAPGAEATTVTTGPAPAPAPTPVFASVQRTSTPKGLPQTLAKEQKFQPPVMVDGEKLKGIGGKRRDSEEEYVVPVSGPALAVGDLLGLSESHPISATEKLPPMAALPEPPVEISPIIPATLPVLDSTPAMSTSATTPTSPQSLKTPRGYNDTEVPTPQSSPPAKTPEAETKVGQWQFVGPTMSGFISPLSNSHQPSLAQSMDTLQGKSSSLASATAANSRTASGAGQTRKVKPFMDGPIIFTSTRPVAAEKGENTFKSVASLRAAGETSGWKKGKDRAQGRRAVLSFGQGLRSGSKRREGKPEKKWVFGEVDEDETASEERLREDIPAKKPEDPAAASAPAPTKEAEVTPAATDKATPSPSPVDAAILDRSPTPPPAPAPVAPRKPATWAALVGSSRTATAAPSVASTSATPSASAAPSKLPSPTRASATLPHTPELSPSDLLASSSSLPAAPSSAPGPGPSKRPSFNYAAAAAAGAALSPADELVKLLSEGLGSRGLAPGISKGTIPRGLINTGNMCFINTILQTLAYCPPFTDLLETLGQRLKADLGRKTPLLESVIVFLRELQPSSGLTPMMNGSNGTLTPRGMSRSNTAPTSFQNARGAGGKDAFVPENVYEAMKENKRFDSMRRGHQEDAEEYLGFFLNTLHEELLFLLSRTHTRSSPQSNGNANGTSDAREHSIERPVSPSAQNDSSSAAWLEVGKKQRTHVVRSNEARESAITRIFGGTLRSILHTPGLKDSVTLEPYQPLQLDISDPSTTRSVVDALRHLSTPEIVQTWSPAKKENVDATKTVFVETWPGVLICHLKRFVYDSEEREVVKKSRAVAYGTELIVPNEIISPTKQSSVPVKYRLFGVVYHHGSTASGGHYTVAVSRQDHQQWIHFDDETVQPVPTEQVIVSPEEAESGRAGLIGGREKCAYLLFYQRIRA